MSGADSLAFVDLLDAQDKVVRTVPVVNGRADFYFLNPGKYSARLINDRNGNGVWDTGKYEDKRQPEEVKSQSRASWPQLHCRTETRTL